MSATVAANRVSLIDACSIKEQAFLFNKGKLHKRTEHDSNLIQIEESLKTIANTWSNCLDSSSFHYKVI